jgi:uncharacterized protein (AIM24 family)
MAGADGAFELKRSGSDSGNTRGSATAKARDGLREWFDCRDPLALGQSATKVDDRTLLVDLEAAFAVRANAIVFVESLDVARQQLRVDGRGSTAGELEPLGGSRVPILGFRGPGRLMARLDDGQLELFGLEDERIIVRLSALFGLSLSLRYSVEKLRPSPGESVEFLRMDGRGVVALGLPGRGKAVDVGPGGLVVRASALFGWTARVLPEPLDSAEAPGQARGFLALQGEGTAILV